jgi:hypothetical protein
MSAASQTSCIIRLRLGCQRAVREMLVSQSLQHSRIGVLRRRRLSNGRTHQRNLRVLRVRSRCRAVLHTTPEVSVGRHIRYTLTQRTPIHPHSRLALNRFRVVTSVPMGPCIQELSSILLMSSKPFTAG